MRLSMNPIYFETLFAFGSEPIMRIAPHPDARGGGERGPVPRVDLLPASFAIITAYATTGETWTREENDAANDRLRQELEALDVWMRVITGYSPSTQHAEPGWAVAIGFDVACDLGRRHRQDAIFFVTGEALYVSYCDERRGLVAVGAFRERLTPAPERSRE